MRRFVCWVVLACLGLAQAHAFVPHHHHAADAAAHEHELARPSGASHCITDCHPDLIPHEESVLDPFRFRGVQAMDMPLPLRLAPIPVVDAPVHSSAHCVEPRANSPPGTKSSRGPPASQTA